MKEKLNDADLEDALIPKWGVGCRRLSPSTRYLEVSSCFNAGPLQSLDIL